MKQLLPRLVGFAGLVILAACHDNGGSSSPAQHALSGSLSGLTAAGLILADGNTTAAIASGASTFTLGSSFTTGTAYAVTVQAQPTNQVCTVANGAGTVGTTDVTNVAVTCTNSGYQIGGTVSGLTAAGLMLANGSDTVAVTSGAASFSLAAPAMAGAAYSVTVQTQPTGQTCSVANGSGTVGTAPVANVVVTCADQAFQLGGTLSGLSAGGLVLANGGDMLTVAANTSSFAMPSAVAVGSSYNVTVQTQPAGLACAVINASSTMPSSNVANVAVSCTAVPFTLGGTIQGLSTSGLVLSNGSDLLTLATSAASFTMPIPVSFGSTYGLAVQTQPVGLSCSFSNGGNAGASSGTMPAHNIVNVALVCAPQSYMLGGTVSGLSSGTLVLANGSDTIGLTVDGSFQMLAPVAYGSTYTVTVQTQPTGLTCSVGNATGPMPASDVTDVAVTCAASSYPVGGTVSGLSTTGLILQNNGTDDASVAANAAQFSMQTSLAYGSTYNITILTQPAGQTCTVTNGSGQVGAAITNVQIDCPHSVSFSTAGAASWTVPAGVSNVTVTVYGGGGGGGGCCGNSTGGNGAAVTSTLAVQPGDSVTVYVGAGGGHVGEGGGGGGLTYVGDGAVNFVVAGGGGGGGGGPGPTLGNGGNAGSPGGNGGAGTGGAAGGNGAGGVAGSSAVAPSYGGTNGNAFIDTLTSGSGSGGLGGGGSADGPGGAGISNAIGNGGNGAFYYGAGGGGGGYGGGGGGGNGNRGSTQNYGSGGGGGGGSFGPAGTTISIATAGGPGAGGGSGTTGAAGAVTINYP